MKAVVCDRIEKLKFRDDLSVPSPAPDQVLIRVMHTGFRIRPLRSKAAACPTAV